MRFPETAAAWREAIENDVGITAVQGEKYWAEDKFPYEALILWMSETYHARHGYSPQFVPALLRNIRGLVAWVYGDGSEPYWPGSDSNSQT